VSSSAVGVSAPWMQQLRSLFIQTLDTPNPESLKFLPDKIAILESEDGTGYYATKNSSATEIARSPLAKQLFSVEGVKAVYLGNDFVTITKYAENKWKFLRPQVFEAIMEWADGGKPALLDQPDITDTTILEDDTEIVAMIKELIEARIRPAVQEDGGDILFVGFEEETGIVTVKLAGSCVGCPSSSVTLKNGAQNMLQHYIPEVTAVVALEDEEEDSTESGEVVIEKSSDPVDIKQKSYEERLAQAGIPFSD
jgi:Fe-S cluster biogenesis protein NfuA